MSSRESRMHHARHQNERLVLRGGSYGWGDRAGVEGPLASVLEPAPTGSCAEPPGMRTKSASSFLEGNKSAPLKWEVSQRCFYTRLAHVGIGALPQHRERCLTLLDQRSALHIQSQRSYALSQASEADTEWQQT